MATDRDDLRAAAEQRLAGWGDGPVEPVSVVETRVLLGLLDDLDTAERLACHLARGHWDADFHDWEHDYPYIQWDGIDGKWMLWSAVGVGTDAVSETGLPLADVDPAAAALLARLTDGD